MFILGWVASSVFGSINLREPSSLYTAPERFSPSDWVKEDQIKVYKNQIILDIQDASCSRFTDTNSMDPLLDAGSNGLEIMPQSAQQLNIGDVISYRSNYSKGILIHRIVQIGKDTQGWYCRVKGDNVKVLDPGKIRFNQVEGVLVGVIY